MPVITLPDGSTRSYETPVSVMHVAADIGAGLAKATLAGRVNGELVDASFIIQGDASLAIVTSRDTDALELFRHDAAHVMAQAVQELFPGTQVTIGPAIEDGFYYDNKNELIKALKKHLTGSETVLVKGSRSAAMEEVVERILTHHNNNKRVN